MGLSQVLTAAGQTRWLDVGCGAEFSPGFDYLDILPVGTLSDELQGRYHRADIANLTERDVEQLGIYDLVRMQHTFEHFGFEDGLRVLQNCAAILNPGGVILISVPDLVTHVQALLNGYEGLPWFKEWAHNRIPDDAPPSAYFSVFTHSLAYEPHLWCYDYDGLAYQLERTKQFTAITKLERTDLLAEVPFTHNRPDEDLCVYARRIQAPTG